MSPELTLPPVDEVLAISKAIAMLDAVLMPEWQYRYYSFNSRWGPGEQMASMRDGSGNSYFILFNRHGAIIKGYDHESPAAEHVAEQGIPLPGMFDGVPDAFAAFLNEPAFSINETTFCYWRRFDVPNWLMGCPSYPASPDPGGARLLLSAFQGPASYAKWSSDYYEVPVDLDAVRRIYHHEPLTPQLIHALNPQMTLEQLNADIEEIGYPLAHSP